MNKPRKFPKPFNFFLTPEEKELFFNLKKIYKLDRELGSTDSYQKFLYDINNFYHNILSQISHENKNNKTNNE